MGLPRAVRRKATPGATSGAWSWPASRPAMCALFPVAAQVAQRLRGRWHKAARSGRDPLQADLMRYTVDAIAGLAFGTDINTLESDEDVIQHHLDKVFPALFRRILSRPLLALRSPGRRPRTRTQLTASTGRRRLHCPGPQRMRAGPSLHEHPRNLLEAMIAAADQPGSGIDDKQVAGNVLTMLLAGEDTTANTLAWMIHLLQRNPQALQRATKK